MDYGLVLPAEQAGNFFNIGGKIGVKMARKKKEEPLLLVDVLIAAVTASVLINWIFF